MDILKKIEKNECKFGKKVENNICSDDNVIKMMEDMLKKLSYKNIGHEPLEIIKKSNEITNCNSESCIISSKQFIKLYGEEKADSIKKELFKNKANNLCSVFFTAGFPNLNDSINIIENLGFNAKNTGCVLVYFMTPF